MKPDCGIPFKVWCTLTVALEIIYSGAIAGFAGWIFCFRLGENFRLLYTPSKKDNYIVKNHHYESTVMSWILVVLLCLCVVRVLSSILLSIGAKKSSADISRLWIAFKGFAIMISVCLLVVSFTVGILIKMVVLISVVGDLLTAYFIPILYPELEKMRKFIKVSNNKSEEDD